MTVGQSKLANLPEDLPPAKGLIKRLIQPGDYRKGLTPRKDLAVHATQPFPANSVLGVYRCIAITGSEELDLKYNSPEEYTGCNAQWRQALDMYAAEIAPPAPRTWGKRLLQEVFDEALQVRCEACKSAMLMSVNLFIQVLTPSQPTLLDRNTDPDLLYIIHHTLTAMLHCRAQYKPSSMSPCCLHLNLWH